MSLHAELTELIRRGRQDGKRPEVVAHAILAHLDDDEPIYYDGPDPSVECAYRPCLNRLRQSDFPGPQWCSRSHREESENASRNLESTDEIQASLAAARGPEVDRG